ncbi:L,D-transpeptidase [Pseudomaricurvus hydrocarbonicus]
MVASSVLLMSGYSASLSTDAQPSLTRVAIALPLNLASPSPAPSDKARDHLRRWFANPDDEALFDLPLNHQQTLRKIYARTGYRLLWQENGRISAAGKELLQQLAETSADLIYDYPYHLDTLQQRLRLIAPNAKHTAALDVLMTDAFVAYAEDLFTGRLLPSHMEQRLPATRKVAFVTQDILGSDALVQANILKLFEQDHSPQGLLYILEGMVPAHPEYGRLRQALDHYQQLAQSGAWQPMPEGPVLEKGMRGEEIGLLRQRLQFFGDATTPASPSPPLSVDAEDNGQEFDDALEASLKRFQARHGHTADGRAGPVTRRLLNTPPEYRIRQIALNMKRWREIPWQLGSRYLWVNLTDYRLQLVTDGQTEMDMRVIIGTRERPSPELQKTISTVVLNPSWSVPRLIAVKDIIPKTRQNPNYLNQQGIYVYKDWTSTTPIPADSIDWDNLNERNFRYRLLQQPGTQNALGRVKFVIPNTDAIYLHDTNAPRLFQKNMRSLSSGCVRVAQPLELAKRLLSDTPWDNKRIQRTLRSGKTVYVTLPKRLPVYFFYTTAWADTNHRVQFRDDIYKKDRLLNLTDNVARSAAQPRPDFPTAL